MFSSLLVLFLGVKTAGCLHHPRAFGPINLTLRGPPSAYGAGRRFRTDEDDDELTTGKKKALLMIQSSQWHPPLPWPPPKP